MTLTPEQLLAAYLGYERPAYVGREHVSTVEALRRVEAAVRADVVAELRRRKEAHEALFAFAEAQAMAAAINKLVTP